VQERLAFQLVLHRPFLGVSSRRRIGIILRPRLYDDGLELKWNPLSSDVLSESEVEPRRLVARETPDRAEVDQNPRADVVAQLPRLQVLVVAPEVGGRVPDSVAISRRLDGALTPDSTTKSITSSTTGTGSREHSTATARLDRAIQTGSLFLAELSARELGPLTLDQALDLTALAAVQDQARAKRLATRRLPRWLAEIAGVSSTDAALASASLRAPGGPRRDVNVAHATVGALLRPPPAS
jgi:hypothetical protein